MKSQQWKRHMEKDKLPNIFHIWVIKRMSDYCNTIVWLHTMVCRIGNAAYTEYWHPEIHTWSLWKVDHKDSRCLLDWLQLVILQSPEGSRHFLQNTLSVASVNQLTEFTRVLGVHIHHSEHSVRTEQASHQNRVLLGRCGVWVTSFHSQCVLKITKITTDILRWRRP